MVRWKVHTERVAEEGPELGVHTCFSAQHNIGIALALQGSVVLLSRRVVSISASLDLA